MSEREMMQRVMRESLESQEEGKKGGVDDEMLEEVLKMSLEEKQRQASSAEEEAEQIRKAMEWSMYDFKCEEYDRKRQGRQMMITWMRKMLNSWRRKQIVSRKWCKNRDSCEKSAQIF